MQQLNSVWRSSEPILPELILSLQTARVPASGHQKLPGGGRPGPAREEGGCVAGRQFTADVVRLARAYVSAPGVPLFAAMRRLLAQIQAAIERRTYPAQARDLNLLAGALCGLMGNASLDLGRHEAADDLAGAAWTYGRTIDHGPLSGDHACLDRALK
jgi:hypothetical protein